MLAFVSTLKLDLSTAIHHKFWARAGFGAWRQSLSLMQQTSKFGNIGVKCGWSFQMFRQKNVEFWWFSLGKICYLEALQSIFHVTASSCHFKYHPSHFNLWNCWREPWLTASEHLNWNHDPETILPPLLAPYRPVISMTTSLKNAQDSYRLLQRLLPSDELEAINVMVKVCLPVFFLSRNKEVSA